MVIGMRAGTIAGSAEEATDTLIALDRSDALRAGSYFQPASAEWRLDDGDMVGRFLTTPRPLRSGQPPFAGRLF